MNKFWKNILANHAPVDIEIQATQADSIHSHLLQDNVNQTTETLVIENNLSNFRFILQKFGIVVPQGVNHSDLSWHETTDTFTVGRIKEFQVPEDSIEAEIKKTHEYIQLFLKEGNLKALELLKKSMRLVLKSDPIQLQSIFKEYQFLDSLMIEELIDKSSNFDGWDNYFKMHKITFSHGQDYTQFMRELNQEENIEALEKILPVLLTKSTNHPLQLSQISKELLQKHINLIPFDSIILEESTEQFQNHPLHQLFYPKIQWSTLFEVEEHFEALKKFNSKAVEKLFTHDNDQPIAIIALKSKNNAALKWVLESLTKCSKINLLLKTTGDGMNVLMHAAFNKPEFVQAILDAIFSFDDTEHLSQKILTHKNKNQWDALKIAFYYQTQAVAPIFEAYLSMLHKNPISENSALIDFSYLKPDNNLLIMFNKMLAFHEKYPEVINKILKKLLDSNIFIKINDAHILRLGIKLLLKNQITFSFKTYWVKNNYSDVTLLMQNFLLLKDDVKFTEDEIYNLVTQDSFFVLKELINKNNSNKSTINNQKCTPCCQEKLLKIIMHVTIDKNKIKKLLEDESYEIIYLLLSFLAKYSNERINDIISECIVNNPQFRILLNNKFSETLSLILNNIFERPNKELLVSDLMNQNLLKQVPDCIGYFQVPSLKLILEKYQQSGYKDLLAAFLKQPHRKDGKNLLMLAVQTEQAVQLILDVIVQDNDKNLLHDILKHVDSEGSNALMHAIKREHTKAVDIILDVIIQADDKKLLHDILMTTNVLVNSAVNFRVNPNTELVKPILKALLSLTDKEAQKFVRNIFKNYPKNGLELCDLLKLNINHHEIYQELFRNKNSFLIKLVQRSIFGSIHINWPKLIHEHPKEFDKFDVQSLMLQPNILIECAKSNKEEILFTALSKIEKLHKKNQNAMNQLIQEFMDSEQSIQTKNHQIPSLIIELLQKTLPALLHQKDKVGNNVLMIAARYNPDAVKKILDEIVSLGNKELLSQILQQKNKSGYNALDMAMSHHTQTSPNAVDEILKAIKSLDIDKQSKILSNTKEAPPKRYHDKLKELYIDIFQHHMKAGIYNDKFRIDVEEPDFKFMQDIYHLNGFLQNNPMTLKAVSLDKWKKLLKDMFDEIKISDLLLRLQDISMESDHRYIKKQIDCIVKNIEAFQLNDIEWPANEPYNTISNNKEFDSIIQTLSPSWLAKNINEIITFKKIFQKFPKDWQEKYFQACFIELNPQIYNYLYEQLQSIEYLDELSKDTAPSAPPLVQIISNDEFCDNLPIAQPVPDNYADTSVINEEIIDITQISKIEIHDQSSISPQEYNDFWMNFNNRDDFLKNYEQLKDEKQTYKFICFMRNQSVIPSRRQNLIKSWIQNDPKYKRKFHLDELIYFAEYYENLAQKNRGEINKQTKLTNLSKELKSFKLGLDLIYETAESNKNGYEYQYKIYENHHKWITHYLLRFEAFNNEFTGMMNFTSTLQHPNGSYANTLVELAPRKPIPEPKPKSSSSTKKENTEQMRPEFLINSIQTFKKEQFIQNVKKYANEPKFFKHSQGKCSKNLLLFALETKDSERINAVAEAIYHLDEGDRKEILKLCNNKGYRFTRYLNKNSSYLYQLELERLTLKLQSLNSCDPNIKVLENLALNLRARPDEYLEDIDIARKDLKKNSCWRQWFQGGYRLTDYGIGIFKETIDDLLTKIEQSIHSPVNKP